MPGCVRFVPSPFALRTLYLDAVRHGVASHLGQLPAVLALGLAQQAFQIVLGPRARFGAAIRSIRASSAVRPTNRFPVIKDWIMRIFWHWLLRIDSSEDDVRRRGSMLALLAVSLTCFAVVTMPLALVSPQPLAAIITELVGVLCYSMVLCMARRG